MSSNDDDEDIVDGARDADLLSSIDVSGLSDKDKRQKLKMLMVNKRLDELIVVLDTCVADLQNDSKALSRVKTSLKTVQHLSKISERERQDFRLYIEEIRYIARKQEPGKSFEASKK